MKIISYEKAIFSHHPSSRKSLPNIPTCKNMKQALQKMNENKDKNKTESCSFFCLSYESLGTQDVSFVFVGDRKQPS